MSEAGPVAVAGTSSTASNSCAEDSRTVGRSAPVASSMTNGTSKIPTGSASGMRARTRRTTCPRSGSGKRTSHRPASSGSSARGTVPLSAETSTSRSSARTSSERMIAPPPSTSNVASSRHPSPSHVRSLTASCTSTRVARRSRRSSGRTIRTRVAPATSNDASPRPAAASGVARKGPSAAARSQRIEPGAVRTGASSASTSCTVAVGATGMPATAVETPPSRRTAGTTSSATRCRPATADVSRIRRPSTRARIPGGRSASRGGSHAPPSAVWSSTSVAPMSLSRSTTIFQGDDSSASGTSTLHPATRAAPAEDALSASSRKSGSGTRAISSRPLRVMNTCVVAGAAAGPGVAAAGTDAGSTGSCAAAPAPHNDHVATTAQHAAARAPPRRARYTPPSADQRAARAAGTNGGGIHSVSTASARQIAAATRGCRTAVASVIMAASTAATTTVDSTSRRLTMTMPAAPICPASTTNRASRNPALAWGNASITSTPCDDDLDRAASSRSIHAGDPASVSRYPATDGPTSRPGGTRSTTRLSSTGTSMVHPTGWTRQMSSVGSARSSVRTNSSTRRRETGSAIRRVPPATPTASVGTIVPSIAMPSTTRPDGTASTISSRP